MRTSNIRDGVRQAPDGALAGSDLDRAGAVRNTIALLDLPLEQALAMACTAPASFLGLAHQRGRIAPGLTADLVLLDHDLTVRQTWINGQAAIA